MLHDQMIIALMMQKMSQHRTVWVWDCARLHKGGLPPFYDKFIELIRFEALFSLNFKLFR